MLCVYTPHKLLSETLPNYMQSYTQMYTQTHTNVSWLCPRGDPTVEKQTSSKTGLRGWGIMKLEWKGRRLKKGGL